MTAKTDAANHNVTYSYTTDGKLASRTWARGIVTNYSYDSATGKLLNVDYADDTPDITYTYNRLGKLASVTDAVGMRTFAYNDTFDLISETINGIYSKVINRSYTSTGAKGEVLGMSIGSIQNYTYAYDTYGRLNKITTPAGDFNYTRLTDSDLIAQMTRPNGVNTTWGYENNRNLVTEVNNGGISIFSYTNNAIGNRTSMSRSGTAFSTPDTISYTYDDRSEVTGASSNADSTYNYTYNFDPIGNRLTSSLAGTAYAYTSNNLNQYTAINTEQPTYDADGNMLTNGNWNYIWNGANRMIEAENASTGVRLQFDYDYMGRRIYKKVYQNEALTKYLCFAYDKFKLVEELDMQNNNIVLRRYCWQSGDAGPDIPLSIYDAATDTNYVYTIDANKNVEGLTTINSSVGAHYEYSPFGQQTVATGTHAITNPFRFSSEYYDSETTLVYYNFRYYNSVLGCWLSKDPIEESGGVNLYNFTKNDAVNHWDIYGEACCGKQKYDPTTEGCCQGKNAKGKIVHQIYNLTTECCTKHKRVIPSSSKVTAKVCIRPLDNPFTGWTTLIVHCFLDVPSYGAWGFFNGKGIAPEPSAAGTVVWGIITRKSQCQTVQCSGCVDDTELGLEISDYRSSSSYSTSSYHLTKHNCCHWTNDVLNNLGCNGVESYFPDYSLPTHPAPVAP